MDEKQAKALRAEFPKAQVLKIPATDKRPALDYVSHASVTDRLLAVDPEWSWMPLVNAAGQPVVDLAGPFADSFSKLGLWITLTVGGVTKSGYGDGKNIKEAISDALRNAAMRFGVALDLWAKEDLHAEGSLSEGEQRAEANAHSERVGTDAGRSGSSPSPSESDFARTEDVETVRQEALDRELPIEKFDRDVDAFQGRVPLGWLEKARAAVLAKPLPGETQFEAPQGALV